MPNDVKTRTQLNKADLRLVGSVRACIRYIVRRAERQYDLYDDAEAIPKRTPTPA